MDQAAISQIVLTETASALKLLQIDERVDADGASRLRLVGELDLSNTQAVKSRLDELADTQQPTRVDLSRLEFMDSSGIALLITALQDAQACGWRLEIDRNLSPAAEQVIDVAGIAEHFWPEDLERQGTAPPLP